MNGPVPVGCRVAYEPDGWNTPPLSVVPALALYFFSAVGLAMPKFVSASAPMNDDDRRDRLMFARYVPEVLQPLYRLLAGPGLPAPGCANPPKTVFQ